MSLLARASTGTCRPTLGATRTRSIVTPSDGVLGGRCARLSARAAEAEAEAPAEEAVEVDAAELAAAAAADFAFNFSDAKKGNAWQSSDVEAALAYYAEEQFLTGSTALPVEGEFVTNPLSAYVGGPEDSSWLADVDNNEAYEADDYALAGIPEAAPKVKRNQRDDEDENDEELRAVEDEKISAAAFDDVEGLEDDGDDNPEAAWNWRFAGGAPDEEAEDARAAGARAAAEDTLLSGLAGELAARDELTAEQRDLISMVLDQIGDDAGVELIGTELEQPEGALAGLSAEESAAIAAVLNEQVDATAALAAAARLPNLADAAEEAAAETAASGAPLADAEVQAYINALRGVDVAAATGVDDATAERLIAEGGEVVERGVPALGTPVPLPDMSAVLNAQDPALERFLAAADSEEPEAVAAAALLGELEGLAAEVDEYNEELLPADEDLQEYEALIDAALEYYDASPPEEAGAEPVGEEPVNMYADMDAALLGAPDALGGDAGAGGYYRSEPQYVERILELGRVTKVVKGGKIMGFRCVAVVGDGKGRVGVGCQAGREVSTAVKRALVDAKKSVITVPLVGAGTIPHRSESWFKSAGVVLQPAADGTGVIAGGAVRSVLELAGVQNVLAKRLGSRSTLNNARVTLKALSELRTMEDYAAARGLPLDYMLS